MNTDQSPGGLLAATLRHASTLVPFSRGQWVFHQDDEVKDAYVVQACVYYVLWLGGGLTTTSAHHQPHHLAFARGLPVHRDH